MDRIVLYHWRDRLAGEGDGTTIKSPVRELRREIRDLKRVLAEKTLEADFFRGVSHGPFGPPIEMKMLATCHVVSGWRGAVRVV